jgi:hypothetical protein
MNIYLIEMSFRLIKRKRVQINVISAPKVLVYHKRE